MTRSISLDCSVVNVCCYCQQTFEERAFFVTQIILQPIDFQPQIQNLCGNQMFIHTIILINFLHQKRIQTLNKFFESFYGIKLASNNGGGLSPKRYLASILYASLRFHRPRVINMEDASMIPRSFINLIEYYRHCFHFQLVSSFSSWKTESIHHTHHCLLLACQCLLAPPASLYVTFLPGNKGKFCYLEMQEQATQS